LPAVDFEYGNAGARSEEVDAVRAIYDAFARRDVEAALPFVSEDLTFSPEGTARLAGRTEPYRGHDGLRQYFEDVASIWEDLILHATDIRASAGGVVVFGRVEGTIDGRRYEADALWTWQVRDGKAVAARATALGAPPSAE
jgi:ketosteroid isomerase-like protein